MTTTPGDQFATASDLTRIRPPRRWQAIDFAEMWAYRNLLVAFALRDIKLRYKQTALGVLWVVLQPLLGAGIFTFIFGTLAEMPTGGVPQFLISFCGMFAWTAFSQTVSKSSECMVANAGMVSKVYFPRLILPIAQVPGVVVDLVVAMAMTVVLLLIYGVNPGWRVLTLPVWLALIFMLSLGVGNWAGALMVSYRDVRYVLPVAVQFLMWASPVGYTLAGIEQKVPAWATNLYMANPLASLVEACRWSMVGSGTLDPAFLVYSAVVSVAVFVFGAYVFKGMEKRFADVI